MELERFLQVLIANAIPISVGAGVLGFYAILKKLGLTYQWFHKVQQRR